MVGFYFEEGRATQLARLTKCPAAAGPGHTLGNEAASNAGEEQAEACPTAGWLSATDISVLLRVYSPDRAVGRSHAK